jgi:hypothetical protein
LRPSDEVPELAAFFGRLSPLESNWGLHANVTIFGCYDFFVEQQNVERQNVERQNVERQNAEQEK